MANLVTPLDLQWADPQYTQSVGNARSAYDAAVNPLIRQRGQVAADYGFTPTYDAGGYVQSVNVDPTNPYSKANLLTQSYKEGQKRNTNQFAGRGQLYAGSLNAAQGQATKGYNIGSNNLQEAFINFIAGNQAAQDAAANTYNTTVTGEYGNALGRYVPPEQPEHPGAEPGNAFATAQKSGPISSPGNATPIVSSYLSAHPNGQVQQKGNTIYGLSSSGQWYVIGTV